jgi:hypothetical protein
MTSEVIKNAMLTGCTSSSPADDMALVAGQQFVRQDHDEVRCAATMLTER